MAAPNQPIDVDVSMYQNVDAPGLLAFHQLLQQWQVWQQQQEQQHAEFFNQLANIQDQVNNIQASINRIPMQLHNAAASSDAPLLYPPDIVPTFPLPLTKWDLLYMSAAACNVSFVHLGLPPVAAEVPLTQRRQILMDYLGSGMLDSTPEYFLLARMRR